MGAAGVGLFRTEYLYLTHPWCPARKSSWRSTATSSQASPRHRVTIRTLDLGGDKTVPFLGHVHREANPFMGWRSIRLCFEHPEFLQYAAAGRPPGRRPAPATWAARSD